MRALFVFLIALAIAAVIGAFAVNDRGTILITFSDWTIQTSLILFLSSVVLFFITAYILVRSLLRVWDMPSSLRRWRKQRQRRLSEKYLSRGLVALVEGNWKTAETDLVKGARYSKTPLINFLCAARAAQREGRIEKRDQYIKLAYSRDPESQIAIGLTQAELQINEHQTELALATLINLNEQHPDNARIKLMLLRTYTELESWNDVLSILPGLEKSRLLPRENIVATQLKAYAGLMKKAGEKSNQEKLDAVWKSIPRKLRGELHLLEVYTTEKLKFDNTEECELLIKKALKAKWDRNILRLYGLVKGKDPAKQLAFAESLYTGHARDPVLLLTLGRLCIRNSLWGKAATYLKNSIQIEPMPETYREFARLLEQQGDYAAASSYYQHGLVLATSVKPHDPSSLLEQSDK